MSTPVWARIHNLSAQGISASFPLCFLNLDERQEVANHVYLRSLAVATFCKH